MSTIPEQTGEPYITQESASAVRSRYKEGRGLLLSILGSVVAVGIIILFVWLLLL